MAQCKSVQMFRIETPNLFELQKKTSIFINASHECGSRPHRDGIVFENEQNFVNEQNFLNEYNF